jgi:hypothetical protein
MALTKDFRETIRERAQQEPRFRTALLREAIELMLSGDEKTGRAILRNYINATVAFGGSKIILAHLQAQEGVSFEIRPRRS